MYTTSRNPSSVTKSYESGKINHCKRRRNRIKASCLNCYASKRKCDKKRPCTRCVRLGSTAFCVYETDEPYISDYDHLNEIKQLCHRIVEGIVKQTKQPCPKRPSASQIDPDGFVHFRPNLLYAGDTCSTFNTLGQVHDVSLKQERIVYHSHLMHSDNKAFDNFGERVSDTERACNNSYFPDCYSHDPISSCRTSCGGRSPYSPPNHDIHMGPNLSSDSPPTKTLRNVTASEGEALLKPGYAFDQSPARPLSMGNHSTSMTYKPPSPTTGSHCHCLKDPQLLAPLVYLGLALRTSLEVLEKVHSHGSYCGLFSYISFFENHIFSLRSPQERPEDSSMDLDPQTFSPAPSSYNTATPTDI